MKRWPWMGAVAVLATSGCYTWHDIARDDLGAGTDVRVTLDRETALRRLEDSGDEVRLTVTGTSTEQTDAVSLGLTARLRGSAFNRYESVPWAGVVRLEEKRFSWTRTGGLAALGVGAAVAILSAIEGATDDGFDGPPIDEAPVVRIPIFTIGR